MTTKINCSKIKSKLLDLMVIHTIKTQQNLIPIQIIFCWKKIIPLQLQLRNRYIKQLVIQEIVWMTSLKIFIKVLLNYKQLWGIALF